MCVCVCCGPISMANVFSSNFFFHLSTLLKAYTTFPPHLFVGKEREQKLFHFLFVFAFFWFISFVGIECTVQSDQHIFHVNEGRLNTITICPSRLSLKAPCFYPNKGEIKAKKQKKVSKTYSLLTINFDVLYTIHSTTTKAFELMLQCLLICLLQEIVIILTNHFKLSFLLLY